MVTIRRHPSGRGWLAQSAVRVARPIEEVFAFFSDAFQLETLTPAWLRFHVVTPAPIAMRVGARIDYRLRVYGLPMRWRSEITVWEPPHRFVDEELRGPYSLWRHEHVFTADEGGTLCGDSVQYDVLGGRLVNLLFVERNVWKIFEFRERRLRDLFGAAPAI